jgi:hypothetical protein
MVSVDMDRWQGLTRGFFVGYVNDIVPTESFSYRPTVVDDPDEEGCASSVQIYRGDDYVYGATLDYSTTDTSLFTVEVRYSTTGSKRKLEYPFSLLTTSLR